MWIRHMLSSSSQSKALNCQNCSSSFEQNHFGNRWWCQRYRHDQVGSHWCWIVWWRRYGCSSSLWLCFTRVQNVMEITTCSWSMELYQNFWDDFVFLLQKHAFHNTSMDYCFLCGLLRPNIVWWRICHILQLDFHSITIDIQSCSWARCKLYV